MSRIRSASKLTLVTVVKRPLIREKIGFWRVDAARVQLVGVKRDAGQIFDEQILQSGDDRVLAANT